MGYGEWDMGNGTWLVEKLLATSDLPIPDSDSVSESSSVFPIPHSQTYNTGRRCSTKVMPNFLLTWLLAAVSLVITAKFVPGFRIDSFPAALIAAVILGLVNAIIKPILVVLTLPITIVTLGLFLLVINALTIWLAGSITPGFIVSGFIPALIGSIVLTLVSSVLNHLVGDRT